MNSGPPSSRSSGYASRLRKLDLLVESQWTDTMSELGARRAARLSHESERETIFNGGAAVRVSGGRPGAGESSSTSRASVSPYSPSAARQAESGLTSESASGPESHAPDVSTAAAGSAHAAETMGCVDGADGADLSPNELSNLTLERAVTSIPPPPPSPALHPSIFTWKRMTLVATTKSPPPPPNGSV